MSPIALWSLLGVCSVLCLLAAVMSALLERSGLIRLRHWAAGGGRLERLYDHEGRFEAFRLLFSFASRLSLIAVLAVAQLATSSTWWALGVAIAVALVAELTSRLVARYRSEAALDGLRGAYSAILLLAGPLVALLAPTLRFDRFPAPEESLEGDEASDGEIDAYISVGQREGILEPGEELLVKGVVEFGDTLLRSVMTPRIDMVMASVDSSAEDLLSLFLDSGHSRLPLYGDSQDHIEGVLYLRDLVGALRGGDPVDIARTARPAFIVPDTKPIAALLKDFQARHQQLAVAVDEFGGTAGLATVEDLLEEIVGEIADEHDDTDVARVRLAEGIWLLAGSCDVEELDELFGIDIDDAPYETVGGLVFTALGYLPETGESVERHGLRFEVLGVADRRIQQLRVERTGEPASTRE